jgi:hypothetical protein
MSVLHVDAVVEEPEAPEDAGAEVASSLARLAAWLGAELDVRGDVPRPWADAFATT